MNDASLRPIDLAPFDLETLEEDPATICAVDSSLRIAYVNRAWRQFARENGGETSRGGRCGVGASLLGAISPALRPFYAQLFAGAQASRSAPVEHSYECSSPTVHRRFRMRIFACTAGPLLLVHSLSYEAPHDRPAKPAVEVLYRDDDGLVHQCGHCRRVRRAQLAGGAPEEWDWVPAFAARAAPQTSHTLCELCAQYYFPR